MNTYNVFITPTQTIKVMADKIDLSTHGVTRFYKETELIAVFPSSCGVYQDTPTASETGAQQDKKKIEFVYGVAKDGILFKPEVAPSLFDNVNLVKRNVGNHDLMFAHNDNLKDYGVLYLGHYNDGIK